MVRPLQYHSGLSLEEAKERFEEVRSEFKRVKSQYSGLFGRFKRNMSEKDKELLTDCVGVLLPLELESSVQSQEKQTPNIEDTLNHQIIQLNYQIIEYLSNFKNIGVILLEGRCNP